VILIYRRIKTVPSANTYGGVTF